MVLLADLGEELEARAAVAVPVLHADLGEDTRHGLGADAAVDGRHRAVATVRRPGLVVGRAAPSGQQAGAGELLHADGQTHVGLAGLDRHEGDAQGRGARGARVRHVVDRDPGLAQLLLEHLAGGRGRTHQVARPDDADVLHGHAAVGQRAVRRLEGQVDHVLVRVLAELRHVYAEDEELL